MTAHDHITLTPGCFRCELNKDEMGVDRDVTAEFDDDGLLGSSQAMKAFVIKQLAAEAEDAEPVEGDGLPLPEGTTVTRGFPLGTRIQTERRSVDNKFVVLTTTYRPSITLTKFLLARLAEDEVVAEAANSPSEWSGPESMGAFEGGGCVMVDPERVLDDVEAKRRIVDLLGDALRIRDEAGGLGEIWNGDQHLNALGLAVKSLASVYSNHPDYREEWGL